MRDVVELICALVAASAGLLTAVTAFLRYRAERVPGTSPRAWARLFRFSTRPLPLLALGAILVATGTLLFLVDGDGSSTDQRRTAVRLLRELVSDQARDCRTVEPRSGAVATIACDLPAPMSTMRMSLFRSTRELERVEEDRRSTLNLSKGTCSNQRIAWEEWKLGVLMCDYGDDRLPARFEWTRHDSNVFVEAEAQKGQSTQAVHAWWRNEDNGAPTNNRLPYPDRFEQYILDRTGLPRSACRRRSAYKNSVAALTCRRKDLDYLFLAYFEAKDVDDTLFYRPQEGSCTNSGARESSRRAYKLQGRLVGKRYCLVDKEDKTSVVEWYNTDSRLYGLASRAGTDYETLNGMLRWWRSTGRLLTD